MKILPVTNFNEGERVKRLTCWIKVREMVNVSKRNELYEYAEDENGHKTSHAFYDKDGGNYVMYFNYQGKKLAVNRFYNLSSAFLAQYPLHYDDGKGDSGLIGAVDMDGNIFNPLYAEFDECCENVRLYEFLDARG